MTWNRSFKNLKTALSAFSQLIIISASTDKMRNCNKQNCAEGNALGCNSERLTIRRNKQKGPLPP